MQFKGPAPCTPANTAAFTCPNQTWSKANWATTARMPIGKLLVTHRFKNQTRLIIDALHAMFAMFASNFMHL